MPFTATFQGGVAETRGNGALYVSGEFSWHIDTAGGSVAFATPGDRLLFSTRSVSAADNATIRVLDENGAEISSTAVTNTFQQISINRGAGESLIGAIEIAVGSGEIVIDAFTFGSSTASTDDIACLFAPNDAFVCSG